MPDLEPVLRVIREHGGLFAISHDDAVWYASLEWGHEAKDSPMVAAAAYATGATEEEAVAALLKEAHL